MVQRSVDKCGRATIFLRPHLVGKVTGAADVKRLPDLVVYSLERAEQLQSKAGTAGAGVVTLIDCAGCSLNDMKRFVLAVSE